MIAAPGVCISSTWIGGLYSVWSGTSFSAPVMAGTVALCIAVGRCDGRPANTINRILRDAENYNQANLGYGYDGDPFRPKGNRYYGYLVYAGLY
jgi:subtilisin family serine protease